MLQVFTAERIYPDVASAIKSVKVGKGFRRDPLVAEQICDLLASFDATTIQGKRDFAIVNLMVRTGLRCVEIVRADVGDVSQVSGAVLLKVQGKGRTEKDEVVILTSDALKPILEYIALRGPLRDDAPLFSSCSDRNAGQRLSAASVSRLVRSHLRRIGLVSRRLSAHSLRHSAITLSLQGGASLQAARAMARHAPLDVTLIYAHNLDRVRDAAEHAIDRVLRDAKKV